LRFPNDRYVPARGLSRVAAWTAAIGVTALLVRYDVDLLRLRYWFIPNDTDGQLRQVLGSLREFGQAMAAIVAMCIVATCDRRRGGIIVALLLAELLAAVGYNAGKWTIERYRPSAAIERLKAEGETDKAAIVARMRPGESWVGWHPGNRQAKTQSFPSGHSAAAIVLAATLAAFYPRLAWLLWTLAIGCALSRYLDTAHWLSDCWAGGLIGYAAAWISLTVCGQPRRTQYG
jgi:undecaprenyl-diphosphatase